LVTAKRESLSVSHATELAQHAKHVASLCEAHGWQLHSLLRIKGHCAEGNSEDGSEVEDIESDDEDDE
jgi:hypothetical protein